jgi:hypothetical protein
MRQRHSLAGVPFLRPILLLPILVVLLTTTSSFTGLTASSADEEAKEGFTLAVVRRDSILIPFATYDGKKWKNAWPPPESRVTAPIMLSDVPKRWWSGLGPVAKWTFWPLDAADGASRTLETLAPTWYPAHCQQGLGLRTTYSTREVMPPPHVQPYPKAGLAVSGGTSAPAIAPIEIVDIASSPLVTPLARTLVAEVAEEEKRIIANYMRAGEGWKHPYTEDERKETPFRIEALYKVARGLGDRDVFYFEGLKHYAVRDPEPSSSKKARESNDASTAKTTSQNLQLAPKEPEAKGSQLLQPAETGKTGEAAQKGGGPGQEPCDLVTFVSGWLIGREDELLKDVERIKPKQVKVVVTSCDFAAASIMLPLGVVRVKDKSLWAVQWSGWTHEHYSLTEVKDDDLILAAIGSSGGQCLRK